MIIGKVASGKSSAILSILGEMPIYISNSEVTKSGMKYAKKGEIGYVGQQPLIFSGTVKSNILAGKNFDKKRFGYALKYSCLEKDIEIWENGIDQNVKQNGSNLSGGQKSRLAFARALYSEPDMLVLDDLTSALDPATTEFVLKETIGRVLKGKTVIMSTNDMSVLKFADYIYYFEDGKVVTEGSFQKIQSTELWKKQQELLDEIHAQKKVAQEVTPETDQLPKLEIKKDPSKVVKTDPATPHSSNSKITPIIFLGIDIGLFVYLFKQMGGLNKLLVIVGLMSLESLVYEY